jgi:hypothetical protein
MPGFFGHAPIVTTVTITNSTTAQTVFNGLPIRVYAFSIALSAGSTVTTATIRTSEAIPTILFETSLLSNGNTRVYVPMPFIADKGLQVVLDGSASTVVFTFAHSQAGS